METLKKLNESLVINTKNGEVRRLTSIYRPDRILDSIRNRWNSLIESAPTSAFSFRQKAEELEIPVKVGEFQNGIESAIDTTFEEWYAVQISPEKLFERFLIWLSAANRELSLEEFKAVAYKEGNLKNFWDFSTLEEEFFFGGRERVTPVISFNKVATEMAHYVGKVEELMKADMLPKSAICIANFLDRDQQLLLNKLLTKGEVYNDQQGGIGYISEVYWDVIYI